MSVRIEVVVCPVCKNANRAARRMCRACGRTGKMLKKTLTEGEPTIRFTRKQREID